jgi:hypothetical protein
MGLPCGLICDYFLISHVTPPNVIRPGDRGRSAALGLHFQSRNYMVTSPISKGGWMSRKIKSRWNSQFARFVLAYGAKRLAATLDVTDTAIYQWIRGASTPRPWHAARLRRLASKRGVRLTMENIYRHSRRCRSGPRLKAKSDVASGTKILQFPAEPSRRTSIAQLAAK